MLTGRSFVAHLVFSIGNAGAVVAIRNDFRAAAATHIGAGIYEVVMSDDTPTGDAVPDITTSPEGGVAGGKFVGTSWLRTAANTYRIYTHPANVQLDAGPPAVFGFAAGGASADPAAGTIITFSLDRVDTI